jgi:hypothetical protein
MRHHQIPHRARSIAIGALALGLVGTGATAASAAPAAPPLRPSSSTTSHQPERDPSHSDGVPRWHDRDRPGQHAPTGGTRSATRHTSSGSSSTTATATASASATTATSGGSTAGVAGLSANARQVLSRVRSLWPQITSFSGYRAGAGDHGTGHAVDLMVPGWSTAAGRATGDEIAAYVRAHAAELGVTYVIWRQHIWSVARAGEGWRLMPDRGSVTQNHYDHVHVSVA